MIQKKIHYCWFGNSELPLEFQNFISGWKTLMPDFEIVLWNEENSPMHLPYMQKALKYKKWANLSNYTRLHAVYEQGGFYLDTDVQVVKSFETLLDNKCFFGLQQPQKDVVNSFNNAIFGAEKNHWFVKRLKDALLALYDGTEIAYLSSPHLTTYFLKDAGYSQINDSELIDDDIKIYPPESFYPYHWEEEFSNDHVTENTYAIHFWSGSWADAKPAKRSVISGIKKKLLKK